MNNREKIGIIGQEIIRNSEKLLDFLTKEKYSEGEFEYNIKEFRVEHFYLKDMIRDIKNDVERSDFGTVLKNHLQDTLKGSDNNV